MRERVPKVIDRVPGSNRVAGLVAWGKGISGSVTEMDRPLDYVVEGGPILRGVAALVMLTVVIAVSWVGADVFSQYRTQRITLFSALASIFLTFGLIWVYLSIAESERTQAEFVEEQTRLQEEVQDLQEDQVEIMSAEFEPVIEVLEFSTGHDPPSNHSFSMPNGHPFSGDVVNLTLSNPSTAIATNLRLRFVIDHMGPRGFIFGRAVPLSRTGREKTWTAKPGAIIRGEQSEVEYEAIAGMSFPPAGHDATFPFSYCLSQLMDNEDVSRIRVGILVTYEDRKGDEHQIELEGLDFSPSDLPGEDPPTLETIRKYANRIPIEVIYQELLRKGIPEIPPRYQ